MRHLAADRAALSRQRTARRLDAEAPSDRFVLLGRDPRRSGPVERDAGLSGRPTVSASSRVLPSPASSEAVGPRHGLAGGPLRWSREVDDGSGSVERSTLVRTLDGIAWDAVPRVGWVGVPCPLELQNARMAPRAGRSHRGAMSRAARPGAPEDARANLASLFESSPEDQLPVGQGAPHPLTEMFHVEQSCGCLTLRVADGRMDRTRPRDPPQVGACRSTHGERG